MSLVLYNTLSRKKEEFHSIEPGKVRMYTCGPTVYNYAHIGNLRSYIFADVLKRTLEYFGYEVNNVINVTDVGHLTSDEDAGEDKLDLQSKKTGKSVWEIAQFFEDEFFSDIEKLNIKQPTYRPKATDHVQEMIEIVKKLIEKGHAYETDQAIYFDITTFPTYTELSKQSLEDKITAARDEVNEDPQKKSPADFALWFKLKGKFENHIMKWDSPWGEGFPGWHIECSAMSMKYLGESFDIHTGGEDHIWVHHPNEIAQSEGATGKKYVNYWLHGAFLVVGKPNNFADDEQRMGKSEGNFLRLQTLIENGYDPLAYRYFCYSAHYRSKLKFTWEALDSAAAGYKSLKDFITRAAQIGGNESNWVLEYRERFKNALADDLNIPQAMACVAELIREAEKRKDYGVLDAIFDFDRVLGLNLKESAQSSLNIDEEIESLIKQREQARKDKDWAKADEIR
ncbi:MAG: cysteine--tRNA ligase, partial [Armatimonadota bacterium]